jgi:hypothetical protein
VLHEHLEHLKRPLVGELPEVAGLRLAEASEQPCHELSIQIFQARLRHRRLVLARLPPRRQ